MVSIAKESAAILAMVAAVTLLLSVFALAPKEPFEKTLANESLIYSKTEGWGPCPPGAYCAQKTTLYSSGLYVREGAENFTREFGPEFSEKFVGKAMTLGFPEKNCSAELMLDYYAKYSLTIGGKTQEFVFPGCEREIRELETLLPKGQDPIGGV